MLSCFWISFFQWTKKQVRREEFRNRMAITTRKYCHSIWNDHVRNYCGFGKFNL